MNDYRDQNTEFNENEKHGYAAYEAYNEQRAKTRKRKKRKSTAKVVTAVIAAAAISGGAVFAGTHFTGNGTTQTSAAGTLTGDFTSVTTALDSTNEGTVADVAASAINSLVTISCTSVEQMRSYFGGSQAYEVSSAGSGVIIGIEDGKILIATNNHVVSGATTLSVGFVDETAAEAYVKGTDSENDLAVVIVNTSDVSEETLNTIKAAAIGDSTALVLGDQVVAIGNALGYGQSVTSGYVSAFDRTLTLSDGSSTFTSTGLIQTDASINSGNSGGGLFNMQGELIAINEAKASTTSSGVTVDNMGYAIPMAKAVPILQDIINSESTGTDIGSSEDENIEDYYSQGGQDYYGGSDSDSYGSIWDYFSQGGQSYDSGDSSDSSGSIWDYFSQGGSQDYGYGYSSPSYGNTYGGSYGYQF